jgi:ferredoxin
MISRKRLPRLAVQLICFMGASALLWPAPFGKSGSKFVLQLSPFTAICSSVALRAIGVGAAIGLLFAAIALVRPRWFCRYACPMGLLIEGIARIGLRKTSWWARFPQIGKYAALLTLAGAVAGYPLLLWMDPLAIFSSFWSIRTSGIVTSGIAGTYLLIIIALLSVPFGLLWCARICPLGGTQELLASAGSLWNGWNRENAAENPGCTIPMVSVARRAFIAGAAGIGMGFIARRIGAARGEDAPLRPPGAVEEEQFTGLCLRCGNCIRTCPSRIIHSDTGIAGMTGLLAPLVQYGFKYCLEDCCACTQACPSGAIRKLNLDQKRQYIIGEALVDGSLCLVARGRKDCDACARACPFDAVKIYWDEDRYVAYPFINPDKCNGCGACEVVCPTGDIKAIRVWKRTDKATQVRAT